MHYRTLGRTGLSISEVGYGSWGIGKTGWIGADDKESPALQTAIDLGLNFIDTALGYGNGHSEQLVGQVVRKNFRQTDLCGNQGTTKKWSMARQSRSFCPGYISERVHYQMYRDQPA